jgi:methylenetetrahydrofolate reductase (NADPH)
MDSQKKFKPSFSLEFFPPKTEKGAENLRKTRNELAELKPAYISVTFGAGGSTQDGTIETVTEIQQAGISAAPHLSCIASSKKQLADILQLYKDRGISRIVALRGDLPSGMQSPGELRHANELVEFIRKETGDFFKIEVAAYPEFHPQASSASEDLKNFKRKIDAGADAAITQYFFNPDAYFSFIDNCESMNINVPIVPGIMPITNHKQLVRFSDACGAEVPRWIRKRLEDYGDDIDSIQAFGLDCTINLCENLLRQGAPGIHFYSMNKVEPTKQIWQALKLKN